MKRSPAWSPVSPGLLVCQWHPGRTSWAAPRRAGPSPTGCAARLALAAADVHRLLRGNVRSSWPGAVLRPVSPPPGAANASKSAAPSPLRNGPSGGLSPPELAGGAKPHPVIVFADEHIVVVDKPPGMTTMRHAEEVAEFGRRAQRVPAADPGRPAARTCCQRAAWPAGPRPRRPPHRQRNQRPRRLRPYRRGRAAPRRAIPGAHHRSPLSGPGARPGEGRPHRVGAGARPRRRPARQHDRPRNADGQRAVTHVRVVEALGDYTLVECRLETGRTHQVRIHLGEAGTPLCGERVYDRPLHGRPAPDGSGASAHALHAATLGFDHPATGERMRGRRRCRATCGICCRN